VDKLHLIRWAQTQKILFLRLKFTSIVNGKKWSKFTTMVVHEFSIFFSRKVNKIIMKDITILFIENVLKYLPNK